MVYFKVKSFADNKQLYKKRKSSTDPLIPNGYCLIGDELFTLSETKRLNIPMKYLDKVEISKNDIYFCFGARFQKTL